LSPADREKLAEQVRKAHERGRKIRFWNAPDNDEFWKTLYDADVDLINTDRLEPLRNFLTKHNSDE
jgi:alkaline phosphatase